MYGQVQLVAAAALGRLDDLVAEHRELLVRRSLGPDDLVVEDVAVRRDLVARDDGPLRVAEQPRVHEREVAEVGEVLDLARRVARPPVRPAGDGRPGRILELGNLGQRPARLLERDPDHPVALGAGERRRARLGRHPGRVGELRDPRCTRRRSRSASRGRGTRSRRPRRCRATARCRDGCRGRRTRAPCRRCRARARAPRRAGRPQVARPARGRPSTRPGASRRGAPGHARRRTARSCGEPTRPARPRP